MLTTGAPCLNSHVMMSVSKLLSRIVAPDINANGKVDAKSVLHDYTFGISSDPLTRFAVCVSALIHDGTFLSLFKKNNEKTSPSPCVRRFS